MIMPSSENTNINTNVESQNFNIEMNGTMFNMLSKNVYNDVILAPIREWSTNAIDACIAAGNEIKFDVHLPTSETPTFSVRDYGTGLTDEEIKTLFATFGASTKRDSNKFNGTFGIGRMSGLAYADQFTIESFIDNTHIVYLVTKKDNIPQMIHLGTSPSTEPTGLKLSLPVEVKDIRAFESKAINVYKYFKDKPTLNKDINITLNSVLQGTNWKISNNNYSTSPKAVMGNVAYRIDTHQTNASNNIILEFELGELSITPGRESLTYDKQTINKINDAYQKVIEEAKQIVSTKLATMPINNYLEYGAFNSAFDQLPYTIRNSLSLSTLSKAPTRYYDTWRNTFQFIGDTQNNIQIKIKRGWSNRFEKLAVTPSKHHIFMIMDTKTNHSTAVSLYEKQFDSNKTVICLVPNKFTKAGLPKFKEDAENLLKAIGITKWEYSSSYVSDARGKTENSGLFKPYGISYINDNLIQVYQQSKLANDYNSEENVLYLETTGASIEPTEELIACLKYLDLYRHYNNKSFSVVGVAKKYKTEAKNLPNFKPLVQYVKELAKNKPLTIPDLSEVNTSFCSSLRRISRLSRRINVNLPLDVIKYRDTLQDFQDTYGSKYHKFMAHKDVHKYFAINSIKPEINTTAMKLIKKYTPTFFRLLFADRYDVKDKDINRYLKLIGH